MITKSRYYVFLLLLFSFCCEEKIDFSKKAKESLINSLWYVYYKDCTDQDFIMNLDTTYSILNSNICLYKASGDTRCFIKGLAISHNFNNDFFILTDNLLIEKNILNYNRRPYLIKFDSFFNNFLINNKLKSDKIDILNKIFIHGILQKSFGGYLYELKSIRDFEGLFRYPKVFKEYRLHKDFTEFRNHLNHRSELQFSYFISDICIIVNYETEGSQLVGVSTKAYFKDRYFVLRI